MKIFLLLLFTAGTLSAQLVSRTELRNTNNALVATIKPKQSGSITLSNFVSFLTANGITNISGGSNAVLYVVNGTLVINGAGSGGATNNIPVLQGTNLQFEVADFDFLNIGVLIPTNTVYVATTNTATTVAQSLVTSGCDTTGTLETRGQSRSCSRSSPRYPPLSNRVPDLWPQIRP